jgi:hypothetical protein
MKKKRKKKKAELRAGQRSLYISYRNVDLCKTGAKPMQNRRKTVRNRRKMGADRGQNWVDSKTRYIIGVAVGRTSLRFEEASTTRPLKPNSSARRSLP